MSKALKFQERWALAESTKMLFASDSISFILIFCLSRSLSDSYLGGSWSELSFLLLTFSNESFDSCFSRTSFYLIVMELMLKVLRRRSSWLSFRF
jgi:hypothetical protein